MNAKLVGVFVLGLLAAPVTQATIITYDFTSTIGNGSFSFDDSNSTTVAQPSGVAGGATWYSAISFVIAGVNVASPDVGVYDNIGTLDCLSVIAAAGFPPGASFCYPATEWSGEQLVAVNALTTQDMLQNTGVAKAIDGGGFTTSIAPSSSSAPAPATLALLGIGLAGLGFSRRRKLH